MGQPLVATLDFGDDHDRGKQAEMPGRCMSGTLDLRGNCLDRAFLPRRLPSSLAWSPSNFSPIAEITAGNEAALQVFSESSSVGNGDQGDTFGWRHTLDGIQGNDADDLGAILRL